MNIEVASQHRIGDWMQTFSGKAFWPLDPRPEELDLEDIAHALGNLCRYGGHSKFFYSVAEHSLLMASKATTLSDARVALMHDATEAYISDVIRPIKKYLDNYAQIEERLWQVIATRYDLPSVIPDSVHALDNGILCDEMQQLFSTPPRPWAIPRTPIGVRIMGISPERATYHFLRRAAELGIA